MCIRSEKQEIQSNDVIEVHHIVFIELLRRIDNIDLIADLIIAFDELPERQAGFKIDIFHDSVGTHDRRSNKNTAHLLAEGRAFIAFNGFFDMLYSLPDGQTALINGLKAVCGLEFEADAHLLAHFIVEVGIIGHSENFLVLSDLLELFVSSDYKHIQSVHEGIDELILIGHHTFFLMDI